MVHFIESFGKVNLSSIDLTTFPEDRMRLIPRRPEGWRLFWFSRRKPMDAACNRMCIVKGVISSRTSEYFSRCREWLLDDCFLTLPASPVLIQYGDNAYSTVFRYWRNFPLLKDLLGLGGFSNNVRASNPSRRSYLLLDHMWCQVVLAFSQHHFLTVDSSFGSSIVEDECWWGIHTLTKTDPKT